MRKTGRGPRKRMYVKAKMANGIQMVSSMCGLIMGWTKGSIGGEEIRYKQELMSLSGFPVCVSPFGFELQYYPGR